MTGLKKKKKKKKNKKLQIKKKKKNPEFITACSECLSFPHYQYTASLNLDTFQESFCSAIIGNYDCEKGLFWNNSGVVG